MDKIVFLDFDGPMVPFELKYKKRRPALVSRGAVILLNSLLQYTGAKIVVTSSWRAHSSVEALTACVRKWGVEHDVLDKTPVIGNGTTRWQEIAAWLDDHSDVESYVIIDDEAVIISGAEERLVMVDAMKGLQPLDAEKASRILEVRV